MDWHIRLAWGFTISYGMAIFVNLKRGYGVGPVPIIIFSIGVVALIGHYVGH